MATWWDRHRRADCVVGDASRDSLYHCAENVVSEPTQEQRDEASRLASGGDYAESLTPDEWKALHDVFLVIIQQRDALKAKLDECELENLEYRKEVDALKAELAEAKEKAEKGYHFHHKSECEKCHRYTTQRVFNDYGAGKEAIYDAPCPCEAEARVGQLQERLKVVEQAENYYRNLIEGDLCGVDHRKPYISHDCLALARNRIERLAQVERERDAMIGCDTELRDERDKLSARVAVLEAELSEARGAFTAQEILQGGLLDAARERISKLEGALRELDSWAKRHLDGKSPSNSGQIVAFSRLETLVKEVRRLLGCVLAIEL